MKSFFNKITLAENQFRELSGIGSLRVASVSGTVTISFDGGDAITLAAGDTFAAQFPFLFTHVLIKAAAGASASVIYGVGVLAGASSSVAPGGATIQAASGSPEGVLDAANGQWAYDAATGFLYINPATSGTSGWVALIS